MAKRSGSWIIAALLCASCGALNASQADNSQFEQQRAKMRADFERMRNEHRSHMSPQGRQFMRQMDQNQQTRRAQEQQRSQNQIDAAKALTVSPSQCALAYEAALIHAKRFADIQPYFSSHYMSVYLGHSTGTQLDQELAAMKRAYMYECKVRGKDKIESNGEAKVWLEGLDATGNKGISVRLRMIPEGSYWRIDGYDAETGLNVIRIPKM